MAATPAADVHPPYLYPDYRSTRLRAKASKPFAGESTCTCPG